MDTDEHARQREWVGASAFSADLTPSAFSLLSLCAILGQLDNELLVALGAPADDGLAPLLTSDLIVSVSDVNGVYQLNETARAAVLARLREERPADELALHTQAFHFFLDGMSRNDAADRRAEYEARCLYHLGELREIHTEGREWQTIARYVAAVRTAAPQQARHLRLLSLYEGFLAVRTGEHARGEAMLTALLDGPTLEPDIRVRTLHALGQVHFLHARYDRALALWHEAHDLARDGADRHYQCRTLLNIGQIHSETGNHALALEYSLQSLDLAQDLHAPAREAHALWEVGYNAMQLGRWYDARSHIDAAIARYRVLGVIARLANLYWCQGVLNHLLGDERESEEAYQRALAIVQSPQHHDPPVIMDTLWYLGFLYQTQERWEEALAMYDGAASVARQVGNQHSLAFIQYRRGDVLQRQGLLDGAFSAYRHAIDGLEALRGETEDEAIKIGLLGTTQQIYEAMVLLCLARGQIADAFDYVERARSRAFLDALAKKSPELYAAADQPVATLAEVQARLPVDALLIEYFTTGVLPRGEHLINRLPAENTRLRAHLAPESRIVIFAVTRDTCDVHCAALDPNALRPPPGTMNPGRRLLHAHHLRLLYRSLIEPCAHLLRQRTLLYLIPHGPLHYVPFMALCADDGEYLLRADGPALALAPSATILLRNCLNRPATWAEGALALGYNDRGDTELFHAEAEASFVARLTGGRVWAGPEAKSQRLLCQGGQVRWLHFAGHAVFDVDNPLDSALILGEEDTLTAREIMNGLDLRTEFVTLSACTTGLSHVVPGDELLGLPRAFFYAGAPTVICTLWEATDVVARLVMERLYPDVRAGRSPAEALRDAQTAVRALRGHEIAAALDRWRAEDPHLGMTFDQSLSITDGDPDTQPFADPFYWAPFMLIGRPRTD